MREKRQDVPFFKFAFTNVFYYVGLQLIFSIDLWAVKYYLPDETVGQYVSAASVAKIPYFLSLAVSAALLPSISLATKNHDEKRVRDIVRLSLRYWLMLLLAMIVVVTSIARPLILFFFGEPYRAAGPILVVLFAAISLITFFAVMNTVLIARDRLKPVLATTGLLIAVHVLANVGLVPKYRAMGAALATLLVALVGTGLTTWLLLREVQAFVPGWSVVRTVAAGATVLLVGYFFPVFDHAFLAQSAVVFGLFVGILFLVRELNAADLQRIYSITNYKLQIKN